MNETLEIVPGRSIGPFQLKMTRKDVWSLFRYPIRSFYKTPMCEQRTDSYELLGVHLYYDQNETVQSIESFFPVKYNRVRHRLDGNLIDGFTVGQLREICALIDSSVVENDYGFSIPGLNVFASDYRGDQSVADAISVYAE